MTSARLAADAELRVRAAKWETLRAGLRIIAGLALRDSDAAEEAVQEVLVRVHELERSGGISHPDDLPRIAHGIARHVLADEYRRHTRRTKAFQLFRASTPDSVEVDPLAPLLAAEERRRLLRAWRTLIPAERELLRLSLIDGIDQVEISRRRGEPPERTRKQKSRALARLRRAFFATDDTEDRCHDPSPGAMNSMNAPDVL